MICKHCNKHISVKTKIHRCKVAGNFCIADDDSFLIKKKPRLEDQINLGFSITSEEWILSDMLGDTDND